MQQNTDHIPGPPQPLPAIGLIDYLQVIAKWSRMISLVTLAAAVISLVYSLFLPNIYTATTMILPADEEKGGMSAMMSQLGGLAVIAGGGALGVTTKTDQY